jgi:hypothetical protein
MSKTSLAPVAVLLAVLLGLLFPSATAQQCADGPTTFMETPPYVAESYGSLYTWLATEVIRQRNGEQLLINPQWIAENTSNPNIYFSARPPGR